MSFIIIHRKIEINLYYEHLHSVVFIKRINQVTFNAANVGTDGSCTNFPRICASQVGSPLDQKPVL